MAGPQMDEDKRALPVTFPVGCLQLWNGSTQLLHFQRGVYALLQEGIPCFKPEGACRLWNERCSDLSVVSLEGECFAQAFKAEFAFEGRISVSTQ